MPASRALPPPAGRLRWLIFALCGEGVALALLTAHSDLTQGGDGWKFVAAGVCAGLCAWAAIHGFARLAAPARAAVVATLFWVPAVLFRLLLLPATPGDDLARYLWEGRIQLHGINPYLLAPDSPALTHFRDAAWAGINHRNYSAIYPPAAELTFRALAALSAGPLAHKLLYAAADLLTAGLLLRLTRSPAAAAWYAWNPLVIYSFAGAAHYDSLMLAALVGAVCLLDTRGSSPSWQRTCGSASLLGVAIALKIVPALLLPVWCFALLGKDGDWRRPALALSFALLPLPALAWAFFGWPAAPIFQPLKDFAYVTRLNDAFWWIVEATAWPNIAQKNGAYQAAVALGCLSCAIIFRRDFSRALLWTLGAALLLSPALHPWYLAWILPFAAWRGGLSAHAWFVFSVSIFGYFLLPLLNPDPALPWREPLWLRAAIWLPPLLALGIAMSTRRRSAAAFPQSP